MKSTAKTPLSKEAIEAVEALHQAIALCIVSGARNPRLRKPGEIIQSMSKQDREALSHLRAEDLARFRMVWSPGEVR